MGDVYHRKWYLKNRERVRARQAEYYRETAEKRKQAKAEPTPATPPAVPDSGPVVALRLELERLRTQDVSFSLAWSCALQVALAPLSKQGRKEWLDALVSTRGAWHSAYTRLPAPELTSLAVLRLSDDTAEPWHAHHHGTRL